MDDECWHVEFRQIIAEICVAERRDAIECTLRRRKSRDVEIMQTERFTYQIGSITRGEEICHEVIQEC
ncbi:hypothetical protein D3C81_2167950 [compost metagenome]